MAALVSSIVKEQKKCNEFMFSSDYLMKKMFSASFFGERSGFWILEWDRSLVATFTYNK